MEIIKRGTPPKHQMFIGKCDECGTIMKGRYDECREHSCGFINNEYIHIYNCLICSQKNVMFFPEEWWEKNNDKI